AADPAVLARAIKTVGGVITLAIAAFVGLRGELVIAIPVAIAGAMLLGYSPKSLELFRRFFSGPGAAPGRTSQVRSEYLEMSLDHGSGQIAGRFIAGPNAGRTLGEFDLDQLVAMISGFDAQSATLLESYLDRRFPAWREHAQRDAAGGQRRPAPAGKMTDEEAYQILGLKPGAGRDEIGRAHRALMKKLHPDQGGSTYLAARVNEAKDTLLRTHHG
ncbi:MAG: DnaJ domain-containing protein, partial [Acetobacteraceae bacterium]|nr:DnaJ domain-containing protein [Acetobacteraceae bacterium]